MKAINTQGRINYFLQVKKTWFLEESVEPYLYEHKIYTLALSNPMWHSDPHGDDIIDRNISQWIGYMWTKGAELRDRFLDLHN